MQRVTRWTIGCSAFLAALLLAGTAAAQDEESADKPSNRAGLDESIYKSLHRIIDRGAKLYNQGDWNGCYRLWEGSLMSLKPLLGDRKIRSWAKPAKGDNAVYADASKNLQSQLSDHPELKEVIDTALSSAEQTPQVYRRAFILRVALDQIRAETKPAKAVEPKKKEEKKPAGTASIQGRIALKGKPLKGGTIVLTNEDGKVESKIDADGTYSIEGVKPGDYKVSIKGAKGAAIPAKYGDPKTTPLRFSVKTGKNNHDVALQ